MPTRLPASAAMATLLCLTSTAAMAQAPSPMSAEQGWSAISRCADEDTERARHRCVDRVLREAGLLTSEMSARQQRNAFGLDERRAAATAPPPPAPPAKAAADQESLDRRAAEANTENNGKAAPPAQPDLLEVELAKVDKAVNGRIFVTTTEGAVWLQMESVEMPVPPAAGDRMTIRKGSLGGFRCSVVSTRLTYRCARQR